MKARMLEIMKNLSLHAQKEEESNSSCFGGSLTAQNKTKDESLQINEVKNM